MSDASPSMVADRYRLDERIGNGPMGEVWRGYDTRADWVVAVKVMGAGAAGADTREALRQHAQAVARVIHPNVAMVLDVGEQDGAPFLVTEYLTGTSLGEELAAHGPLKIVELCDLVGQAAAGLDAAHRAGVFHGQIDPGSFRRAASGVLKVVGFGPAGEAHSPAERAYLAPERAAGGAASAAADLYALGCVCYELLCGHPPLAGAEPPGALRPDVPAELDRLVLAMLADDPGKRPTGGEAVRRALAAIARPGAVPAQDPAAAQGVRTGHTAQSATTPPPGVNARTEVHQLAGPGGSPRAGDTAIYEATDLEPAPTRNRKLFVQMGAAVAAIAVVTVGMVLWAGSREETPVQTAPSATPVTEAPTPAGPTPEPTPSSLPSEVAILTPTGDPTSLVGTVAPKATLGSRLPPGGWDKWLVEFDKALSAQEIIGDINPEVAEKAHDKLRKAARKFADGHADPARNQVAGVYSDLRRAQEHGDAPRSGPLAAFMDDWQLS